MNRKHAKKLRKIEVYLGQRPGYRIRPRRLLRALRGLPFLVQAEREIDPTALGDAVAYAEELARTAGTQIRSGRAWMGRLRV